MRYRKISLLIAILSVVLAGALVAVSEQAQRSAAPSQEAVRPVIPSPAPDGCSEGCGGHVGSSCSARELVTEAKQQLQAANILTSPRSESGASCAPASSDNGARGPKASNLTHKRPSTAARDVATTTSAARDKPARVHACNAGDCTQCENDCPHKNLAGNQGVAGKPVRKADNH